MDRLERLKKELRYRGKNLAWFGSLFGKKGVRYTNQGNIDRAKRVIKSPKMEEIVLASRELGMPAEELFPDMSYSISVIGNNNTSTNSSGADPNITAIQSMDIPDTEKAKLMNNYFNSNIHLTYVKKICPECQKGHEVEDIESLIEDANKWRGLSITARQKLKDL